jgi:hypothetical protein
MAPARECAPGEISRAQEMRIPDLAFDRFDDVLGGMLDAVVKFSPSRL